MADASLKNVISFVITTDEDVVQDFISITFSAIETGPDANAVQASLAVRIKEALDIARPKEVDGQVEVRSGVFQVNPSYDKEGDPDGYQGNITMIVSGIDTKTILALTGEIKSMTVGGVQQSVSPALRKQTEQCLAVRAIQNWRERAKAYSDAFSAKAFTLINADVSINNRYPAYARSAALEMKSADGAISAEPGKETLTVTVSGTIKLSS